MKTILSSDENQYTEIYERTRTRTVRYQLIEASTDRETHYEIRVILGKDRASQTLPFVDHDAAYKAYLHIKQSLVTPTTLNDVIEDMK